MPAFVSQAVAVDTDVHLVAASRAPGIGPIAIEAWRSDHRSLSAAAEQVRAASNARPASAVERALLHAMSPRALEDAARDLDTWRSSGLHVVTTACDGYPDALRHVPAPPPVLFTSSPWPRAFAGPLTALPTVAVVGTRRPSAWGRAFAHRVGADLARRGVTVVSGLALGIDGTAHRAVVDVAAEQAVAVLGSSLDLVHPREHADLARTIATHGLLVSEFPPATSPSRATFPRRNRLISGLSRAIVVIEAGEASGVEHTIRFGLEQGRDVYVVASAPDGTYGLASARRVKEGAIPFTTVDDLIDEALGRGAQRGTAFEESPSDPSDLGRMDLLDLSSLARSILDRISSIGRGSFDQLVPDDADVRDGLAALDELARRAWIAPDGSGAWRYLRRTNARSLDGLD